LEEQAAGMTPPDRDGSGMSGRRSTGEPSIKAGFRMRYFDTFNGSRLAGLLRAAIQGHFARWAGIIFHHCHDFPRI
jgi:hypothetical protein